MKRTEECARLQSEHWVVVVFFNSSDKSFVLYPAVSVKKSCFKQRFVSHKCANKTNLESFSAQCRQSRILSATLRSLKLKNTQKKQLRAALPFIFK